MPKKKVVCLWTVPTFGRLVRDVADFVQLRTGNTASDRETARSCVYPMKKCWAFDVGFSNDQ